jgi:hypothetical protein
MKMILWATLLSVAAHLNAVGAMYTFNPGTDPLRDYGAIPDGGMSGWMDTRTISGAGSAPITGLTVTLNVSGGFNGDLYAFLNYSDGVHAPVLVPLLNHVGTSGSNPIGYSDHGFQITLSDSAAWDVHTYQTALGGYSLNGVNGPLTGAWKPEEDLSAFNGLNPNGNWSLYMVDTTGGGGQSMIESWGLDVVTAVPEPVNLALGVFAGLFLVGSVVRSEFARKLLRKPQSALVQNRR